MALIQPDEAHRLAAYLPEDYGCVAWDTDTPIAVPDAVLGEAMNKYITYKVKLPKATETNNLGISLERDGRYQEAIEAYERNITDDAYLTRHPYDRLAVLYRRAKDYDNEIRVLTLAFERTGDKRYLARLDRAQTTRR